MKALTICQPYAHLICLPDDDPRAKRVENRPWATTYRGPLLIHAGKSRAWFGAPRGAVCRHDNWPYDIAPTDCVFGAIIGVAKLVYIFGMGAVITGSTIQKLIPYETQLIYPWLATHQHVSGPRCLVLQYVKRFKTPIPYTGKQGLFNVPDELVAEAIQEAT